MLLRAFSDTTAPKLTISVNSSKPSTEEVERLIYCRKLSMVVLLADTVCDLCIRCINKTNAAILLYFFVIITWQPRLQLPRRR